MNSLSFFNNGTLLQIWIICLFIYSFIYLLFECLSDYLCNISPYISYLSVCIMFLEPVYCHIVGGGGGDGGGGGGSGVVVAAAAVVVWWWRRRW